MTAAHVRSARRWNDSAQPASSSQLRVGGHSTSAYATESGSSSKITRQGKTGAREFYVFEKTLHERLLQAERKIVFDAMAASDVDVDALEIDAKIADAGRDN